MEQVIKHYGNAIIAVLVLLGLAAIILVALSSNGVIASGFNDMLENFFNNMSTVNDATKNTGTVSGTENAALFLLPILSLL